MLVLKSTRNPQEIIHKISIKIDILETEKKWRETSLERSTHETAFKYLSIPSCSMSMADIQGLFTELKHTCLRLDTSFLEI